MPDLVFRTCSSLQILDKIPTGVSPNSGFLVKSLIKENCHNSRTSNDIDMRLGPVTKLYKRNKKTPKYFDDDIMLENCVIIVFFIFMANLEQSRSRIQNAESAKVMFSLIVNFYLTKTENRTKKSLKQLSQYCFE